MAKFAQLPDAHPVLPDTPIASRAAGSDAISGALGQVSQNLAQTASQMAKEHSQAVLLGASSNANTIMTDAKIQMLSHPGNAEEIQKQSSLALDKSGDVPMKPGDRSRFNYLNSKSKDTLRLQAASIGIKQARMTNQADYMSALPKTYSSYQKSLLSGDEKASDILYQTLTGNARNALAAGIISPAAYTNTLKTLEHIHQQAAVLHSLIGSKSSSAAAAQSAGMDIFSGNSLNSSNLPSDTGTQMLANHYSDNMVKEDINSAIYNMDLNNPHVQNSIMNQSPESFAATAEVIRGSMQAHGVINANTKDSTIEHRIETLNNKPDLTASENAELHVYNNYTKNLSRDFNTTLSHTSEGGKNVEQWRQDKSVADSQVDPSLRASFQKEADNKFMDAQVATATGQHMKSKFINPILTNIVNNAKSSMNLDADPSSLIQQMDYLKPRLRSYLAKQMGGGIPSAVGYWVGHGSDHDTSYKNDMILANQKGRDFSILNLNQKSEDGLLSDYTVKITDPILRMKIVASIPKIIEYAGNQLNGQDRSQSMVASIVNFVKFKAIKNNDFTMKNVDDYIKEATDEGKKSFDIKSGSHYVFNKAILPLTDNQFDMLSSSSIRLAKENIASELKKRNKNITDQEIEAKSSNIDLSTSVTDDKKIVVTSNTGVVYYSAPYNETLLGHARASQNAFIKKQKSLSTYFKGKSDRITQQLLGAYSRQSKAGSADKTFSGEMNAR